MSDFDAAQPLSARDFVAQQLRANPDLSFAEIRERARAAGVSVAPFLYGAARRDLGLPPKVESSSSANVPMRNRAAAAASSDRDEDAPLDLGAAEAELAGDLDEGSHAPVHIPRRPMQAVTPPAVTPPAVTPPAVTPPTPSAGSPVSMAMAGQTRSRSPKFDAATNFTAANDTAANDTAAHEPVAHKPVGSGLTASPTAATAPKGSGFQFAVEALRLSPDILYQDLKARAQMAGLAVPPIVYGRAKAYLGLVPTKPRKPKIDVETAPRSLKQVDSASLSQLPKVGPMPSGITSGLRQIEQLVANVRELEAENRHLRNALQAALSIAIAAVEGSDDE